MSLHYSKIYLTKPVSLTVSQESREFPPSLTHTENTLDLDVRITVTAHGKPNATLLSTVGILYLGCSFMLHANSQMLCVLKGILIPLKHKPQITNQIS